MGKSKFEISGFFCVDKYESLEVNLILVMNNRMLCYLSVKYQDDEMPISLDLIKIEAIEHKEALSIGDSYYSQGSLFLVNKKEVEEVLVYRLFPFSEKMQYSHAIHLSSRFLSIQEKRDYAFLDLIKHNLFCLKGEFLFSGEICSDLVLQLFQDYREYLYVTDNGVNLSHHFFPKSTLSNLLSKKNSSSEFQLFLECYGSSETFLMLLVLICDHNCDEKIKMLANKLFFKNNQEPYYLHDKVIYSNFFQTVSLYYQRLVNYLWNLPLKLLTRTHISFLKKITLQLASLSNFIEINVSFSTPKNINKKVIDYSRATHTEIHSFQKILYLIQHSQQSLCLLSYLLSFYNHYHNNLSLFESQHQISLTFYQLLTLPDPFFFHFVQLFNSISSFNWRVLATDSPNFLNLYIQKKFEALELLIKKNEPQIQEERKQWANIYPYLISLLSIDDALLILDRFKQINYFEAIVPFIFSLSNCHQQQISYWYNYLFSLFKEALESRRFKLFKDLANDSFQIFPQQFHYYIYQLFLDDNSLPTYFFDTPHFSLESFLSQKEGKVFLFFCKFF